MCMGCSRSAGGSECEAKRPHAAAKRTRRLRSSVRRFYIDTATLAPFSGLLVHVFAALLIKRSRMQLLDASRTLAKDRRRVGTR